MIEIHADYVCAAAQLENLVESVCDQERLALGYVEEKTGRDK